MPKVYLKFNLPEEREEYDDAMKGHIYKFNLDNIWNNVFRPRHKHGYNNQRLMELLEDDKCNELMDILENLYRESLEE